MTVEKKCPHAGKKTIPSMMSFPKLGVTGTVECADCGRVVGNCQWVEISPLNFKLKFDPPEIGEVKK